MRLHEQSGIARWGLVAMLCFGTLNLTGCLNNDDNDSGGEPRAANTVYNIAQATTDQCPNGGTVLQVGLDNNSNAVLDSDEITSSSPICNGDPGEQGEPGAPGTPAPVGPLTGVNATVAISNVPASGYFAVGESITVVVAVTDDNGNAMSEADLGLLELRMNGPRSNVNATKIPVGLLRTSYGANGSPVLPNVNFLAATPPAGVTHTPGTNVWTYTTAPVNAEQAGTYTVAIRAQGAALDADGKRRAQDFELADVQVKTATVDEPTIERFKCAACHLGANSGKFYLHHIDSGTPNNAALDKAAVNGVALLPAVGAGGDWARDSNPVRNCKNCHNTDAVAGYNVCALNGTTGDLVMRDTDIMSVDADPVTAGVQCPPGYTVQRRADNIVNRVHGIHMGQHRGLPRDGATVALNGYMPNNTAPKRGLQNPRNIAGGLTPTNGAGNNKRVYVKGVSTYAHGPAAGVVMGNGNFAATNGADFGFVGFPSDVRNCEKCHADDSYQQKPSRLACTTCHDNVNFSNAKLDGTFQPAYFACSDGSMALTTRTRLNRLGYTTQEPTCVTGTYTGEIPHPGGTQLNDNACLGCHGPELATSVAEVHKIPSKAGKFTIEATFEGNANPGYFVAGEQPVLKVVIKDAATGTPVDHTQITQNNAWSVMGWLNGPRAKKMPVLSSAARADITSLAGPFDFTALTTADTIVVEIDGGTADAADVGSTHGVTAIVPLSATLAGNGAVTAADLAAWLNANAVFNTKAVAYTLDMDTGIPADAAVLKIRSMPSYGYSGIKVNTSAVGSLLFDTGLDTDAFNDINTQYDLVTTNRHRSLNGTYSEFNLHLRSATNGYADPKLTLSPEAIIYRMDAVDATIPAGTYTLALSVGDVDSCAGAACMGAPTGTTPLSLTYSTMQIGTATEEPLVASNCTSCHDYDKRWHENAVRGDGYPFTTNYCGSCHDYKQQRGGKLAGGLPYSWLAVAGSSAGSNWGYGAQPHSKRLHGLHFGNYLSKPREIHGAYQVDKVIWPQDARNCEKCHATATSKFSTGNQNNVMTSHGGVQMGVRDADATNLAPWANGPFELAIGGTAAQVKAGTADFEITSGSNVTKPSRIACNGCHDTDAALAHTALQTYDPTPANPFSGDEQESCVACHGANRQFATSTGIMNISQPFQFPYLRNPSWRR